MRLSHAVLFLLLSSSALAQPLHDSVSVEVVNVPVFVTRGEASVQGLTRDDFELLVNGKPQAIEYFDAVDANAAAPGSLRERRLFLLLFDLAFARIQALPREQQAAAALVASAPPSDLFAVATYSTRGGVQFATPFTQDRVALARAIATLDATRSGDPLSIVITPGERTALIDREAPIDRDVWPRTSLADHLTGTAMRELWLAPALRNAEDQLLELTDLAGRLNSLQGQKHVVLLSEGFDRVIPRATPIKVAALPGLGVETQVNSILSAETATEMMNTRILPLARDLETSFQKSDVFLHTLDVTGAGTLMGGDALNMLASSTGGKYVHGTNEFGTALTRLAESYSHTYLLGFAPHDARRGMNTISVRLRNAPRGMKLQYRKGFSATRSQTDVNEGLYIADVLLNDVPQSGTAAKLEISGNTLIARVPMEPLAAQLRTNGVAEMLVYVFDEHGAAIGFHRQLVEVPSGATGEKTFEIPLPAGAKTAKALLRVDDSLGFSRT